MRPSLGVIYPDRTGGIGHTGGDECKEFRILIRRLGEIIERCCCKDHSGTGRAGQNTRGTRVRTNAETRRQRAPTAAGFTRGAKYSTGCQSR